MEPPYAETLGLLPGPDGGLVMPFAPDLIGAPERLHGGTIAGLLEIVSLRAVLAAAPPGTRPKPINVTVDYLRAGLMKDTHARAAIVRLGRRVANVRADAWQDGPDRPIATARMNILLDSL